MNADNARTSCLRRWSWSSRISRVTPSHTYCVLQFIHSLQSRRFAMPRASGRLELICEKPPYSVRLCPPAFVVAAYHAKCELGTNFERPAANFGMSSGDCGSILTNGASKQQNNKTTFNRATGPDSTLLGAESLKLHAILALACVRVVVHLTKHLASGVQSSLFNAFSCSFVLTQLSGQMPINVGRTRFAPIDDSASRQRICVLSVRSGNPDCPKARVQVTGRDDAAFRLASV